MQLPLPFWLKPLRFSVVVVDRDVVNHVDTGAGVLRTTRSQLRTALSRRSRRRRRARRSRRVKMKGVQKDIPLTGEQIRLLIIELAGFTHEQNQRSFLSLWGGLLA